MIQVTSFVRTMAAGFPGLVFATGLAMAAAPAAGQPSAGPVPVALDQTVAINGIEVACTGVGEARDDLRWQAFGVRIEFSNGRNEYLGGGAIRLRDHTGAQRLEVSCDGPWILLKLPAGAYTVEGWVPGSPAKPRSAPVTPPRQGQARFVLQFPDA